MFRELIFREVCSLGLCHCKLVTFLYSGMVNTIPWYGGDSDYGGIQGIDCGLLVTLLLLLL